MAAGVKEFHQYEYPAAQARFTKALYEYQGFHYVKGIAGCRLNLAKTALALGEIDMAEKQLALAEEIIGGYHLTSLSLHADILSSSLFIRQGKLEQAKTILAPYLTDQSSGLQNNSVALIGIIQNRTRIAIGEQNEQQLWVGRFQEAISASADQYRPRLLRFQAALALEEKDMSGAVAFLEEALDGYRQLANPKGVAATMLELGKILEVEQKWSQAAKAYENGLFAGYRIRDKIIVTETLTRLSAVYNKLNNRQKQEKIDQLLKAILGAKDRPWYLLKRLQ